MTVIAACPVARSIVNPPRPSGPWRNAPFKHSWPITLGAGTDYFLGGGGVFVSVGGEGGLKIIAPYPFLRLYYP